MALGLTVLATVAAATAGTPAVVTSDLVGEYQVALLTAAAILFAAAIVGALMLNKSALDAASAPSQ
ncbi:hypothetical protein [Herbiconiux sp. YIM B11900]|uniref:hypothetical protein n=1 Tax=Herbiconiux sp. YIM B11900 TaxID=3404131 RepID=UPI003F86F112